MTLRPCSFGLLLVALVALAGCREEDLDPAAVARGKELSQTCTACHQLASSAHQVGPSLEGIIGQTAGTQDGFDYSAGMKASGIVWTPESLVAFLQDPFAMVTDTKMAVGELSKDEATDVVTYLRSLD